MSTWHGALLAYISVAPPVAIDCTMLRLKPILMSGSGRAGKRVSFRDIASERCIEVVFENVPGESLMSALGTFPLETVVDSLVPIRACDGVDPSWYFMDEVLKYVAKNRVINKEQIGNALANVATTGVFSTSGGSGCDVPAFRAYVLQKVAYLKDRLAEHGRFIMLPSTSKYGGEPMGQCLDFCKKVLSQ